MVVHNSCEEAFGFYLHLKFFVMTRPIIFICIFFAALATFGKKPPVTTIYLSHPDEVIKCGVIAEKTTIKLKETLTYYWYAHNTVFQTQGGFDGRILHGDYKTFYLNNQLKEQGHFYKGLKHKTWTSWNEQGKIREVSTWKNGVMNGTHKLFNANGELELEETLKNGVVNGKQKLYENGKLKATRHFKNGKVQEDKVKAPKPAKEKKATEKTDEPKSGNGQAAKPVKQKKTDTKTAGGTVRPSKEKSQKTDKPEEKQDAKSAGKQTFWQKLKGLFKHKNKPAKEKDNNPAGK